MIGFTLVFALTVVALSAVAVVAVQLAGGALRRRGAHAERRAVELAAVLPVALGGALVTSLVVHGYIGEDHCGVHDHHAHLCVAHGGAWAQVPWIVAMVAATAAALLARLAILVSQHARTARAVAALRRVSAAVGGVRVVDSPRAFCFVAGVWRPEIYASTAAWQGLADDERAAVLAHERGHVAHHDLRRRLGVEMLLAFAAPLLGALLVRRWARATERLRDHDAVAVVGDPDPVARAMVRLCRLDREAATPGFAFAARGDELAERVEALLAGEPTGVRAARVLGVALAIVALGAVALIASQAEPLHHALETLLG